MDYGTRELTKLLNILERMTIEEYDFLYKEIDSSKNDYTFNIIIDNLRNQLTYSVNTFIKNNNLFSEIDNENIIIQNNDKYVLSNEPLAA